MDSSRISVCTIALIHHPPEKAFEILAEAGYKNIDLLERSPHLSLFPHEIDPADIKAAADAHGLRVANIASYVGGGQEGRRAQWYYHGWGVDGPERYTPIGFSSDDPAELEMEMEQMRHAIDLGVFFGARSIRVAAGDDKPESLDKVVSWYKKVVEYAAEKNIILGMENHSAGLSSRPELCVELVEKIGSPYFGILYEPHNLAYHGGQDYRAALEMMKEYIVHCHFKDGSPIGDGKWNYTMMGEGSIDFPWIVEQLEAVGYTGEYALEYEIPDLEPEVGLKPYYEAFVELMK